MTTLEEAVSTLWKRGLNTHEIALRTYISEAAAHRIITRKERAVKPPNVIKQLSPKDYTNVIVESVAARHGLTVGDIMGRSRRQKIVTARHEAIAEVVEARPHWSYPTVGQLFGLDHTSILHALQKQGKWAPRPSRGNHCDGVRIAFLIGQFIQCLSIEWGEPC